MKDLFHGQFGENTYGHVWSVAGTHERHHAPESKIRFSRVLGALLLFGFAVNPLGCNCDEELQDINCDYSVEPSGTDNIIEFGEVEVGRERARTLRIENLGNTALEDFEFQFSDRNGMHYRVGVTDDFRVAVGDTVNISAIFNPLSESTNLAASLSISHPENEGGACPAFIVNLDGSSFVRLQPSDAGTSDDGGEPEESDGGVDGGVAPADGGTEAIDAGTVTPPDAGVEVGDNAYFSARGALQEARTEFASLVLDDGTILLVGGIGENGVTLSSIERFDPSTGISDVVAHMAVPRAFPGIAELPSGLIAIAGGLSSLAETGIPVTTVELFDPAAPAPESSIWCAPEQGECGLDDIDQGKGLLPAGRMSPIVVASVADPDVASLADILVVAFGFVIDGSGDFAPATGGSIIDLSSAPVVTELTGANTVGPRHGEIRLTGEHGRFALVSGFYSGGAAASDAIFYDPVTQSVSSTALSLDERFGGAGTILANGDAIITGGVDTTGALSVSLQRITDLFGTPAVEDIPDVTVDPRFGGSLLALEGDLLLYAGGLTARLDGAENNDSLIPLTTAEVLVPFGSGMLRLSPENNLATPRYGHHAHVVGSNQNKAVFLGGVNVSPRITPHPAVEQYGLLENAFETYGLMGPGAAFTAMGLTPSGGLLSVGGIDPHSGALSGRARVLDAETDEFSDYPPLTEARGDHSVTMLEDGVSFLIAGGRDASGQVLASASIYIPLNPAGFDEPLPVALNRARFNHSATLLDDGSVLLCGGQGTGGEALDTCALFIPPTDTQDTETYDEAQMRLTLGRMSTGRLGHSATKLDTGEVLLVGGGDIEQDLVAADYYDPTDERLYETGLPNYARRHHVAVAIGSGRVLFAGGEVNVGGEAATSTAEVYEHINGIFLPVEDMDIARSGAAGFLLAGGNVLIVGGAQESSNGFPTASISTAELYVPGLSGVGTFEDIDIPLTFGRGDIQAISVFGRAMVAGGTSRDGTIANGNERRTPLFFVDRLLNPEGE